MTGYASKAMVDDSSRCASTCARRRFAFCSTPATTSAPATKRSGGLSLMARFRRPGGDFAADDAQGPVVNPTDRAEETARPQSTTPN